MTIYYWKLQLLYIKHQNNFPTSNTNFKPIRNGSFWFFYTSNTKLTVTVNSTCHIFVPILFPFLLLLIVVSRRWNICRVVYASALNIVVLASHASHRATGAQQASQAGYASRHTCLIRHRTRLSRLTLHENKNNFITSKIITHLNGRYSTYFDNSRLRNY